MPFCFQHFLFCVFLQMFTTLFHAVFLLEILLPIDAYTAPPSPRDQSGFAATPNGTIYVSGGYYNTGERLDKNNDVGMIWKSRFIFYCNFDTMGEICPVRSNKVMHV